MVQIDRAWPLKSRDRGVDPRSLAVRMSDRSDPQLGLPAIPDHIAGKTKCYRRIPRIGHLPKKKSHGKYSVRDGAEHGRGSREESTKLILNVGPVHQGFGNAIANSLMEMLPKAPKTSSRRQAADAEPKRNLGVLRLFI